MLHEVKANIVFAVPAPILTRSQNLSNDRRPAASEYNFTIMPSPSAQQRPTAIQVARCLVKIAYDEQDRLMRVAEDDPLKDELQSQARVDHLKLQKLLYFAQAIKLAVDDEPLFDERIEAWPLGPVVPLVYQEFKQHGADWIGRDHGSCEGISPENEEFLRQIWLEFGKYTATQLVELTHKHAPWRLAKEQGKKEIEQDSMKVFYKKLLVPVDGQTAIHQ